jgi:hypothetical protein
MGTVDPQGVKLPGRDLDLSTSPRPMKELYLYSPYMPSLLSRYSFTFLLALNLGQ